MADNVTIYPGDTGTPIIVAADVIGTDAFQRIKITVGADGTNDGDVSSANPMPVSIASVPSHAVTNAGTFVVQIDGSALTSLQLIDDIVLAEDSVHASGDKGVMSLAVRKDTAIALAGTDGDYSPLITDADGRLHVNIGSSVATAANQTTEIASLASIDGKITAVNTGAVVIASSALPSGAATAAKQPALGTAGTASVDVLTVQGIASMTALKVDGSAVTQPVSLTSVPSHAVTNAGTFAVQVDGSALTSLQLIDDVVYAEDAAHSSGDKGVFALAVRKDTAAALVGTDGDYSPLLTDADGRLHVNVGSSVATAANQSTEIASLASIDGKITAVNTGAVVIASSALPSGASTAAKQPALGTAGSASADVITVQGITSMTALKVDGSAVTQPVSVASIPSHAVTNAGTFVVQIDGSALTSLQLIDDVVYAEDAAHSSGDKGIFALAVRKDTATALAGTDGDYSPLLTDADGRLHVNIGTANITAVGISTEAKQDTQITSLASIDGKITAVNTGAVVISSSVLPTGASTAAKQPALGTAGTASADVLTVQGIASMTALKVDASATTQPVSGTVAATQSGTWTVGLSAAQTLATVTTLGTITNVVHVDDNAGSITIDAPVGTPAFVRLSDGASAISTLPVSLASVPSHAVTNAGTFAVQVDGSALTSLQLIDDVVLAEDAIHATGDKGIMALGVRQDTATQLAGTDGDYSPFITDASGRLHVNVGNTVTVGLPSGASTEAKQDTQITSLASIDGKITAVNTGAVVVSSSALPSGASTAAKQPALGTAGTASADVITVQGIVSMTALKVDGSAVTQPISVSTIPSHDVTNAGTFAVQVSSALPAGTNAIGKLSSNSGVTIGVVEFAAAQSIDTITTITGGGRAHDATDSGNPLKVGSRSVTALSGVTLVASADRSDMLSDLDGALLVRQMAAHGDHVSGNASVAGTGDTSVVAAQGSGVYFYVTGFSVANTGVSATLITIKDGSGGSTLWTTIAPAGGGSNLSCGGKPLFRTSANTALHFACATSSTTVYLSVTGYKSKV